MGGVAFQDGIVLFRCGNVHGRSLVELIRGSWWERILVVVCARVKGARVHAAALRMEPLEWCVDARDV